MNQIQFDSNRCPYEHPRGRYEDTGACVQCVQILTAARKRGGISKKLPDLITAHRVIVHKDDYANLLDYVKMLNLARFGNTVAEHPLSDDDRMTAFKYKSIFKTSIEDSIKWITTAPRKEIDAFWLENI
jgi:hypothetical protein